MKKKLPSPITILFFVIIFAYACIWLIPAGKFHTLSYTKGSNEFVYTGGEFSKGLPFSQATLDSLHILIPLKSFESGAIRKPVSVPGSYERIKSSRTNPLQIFMAPIKGVIDSIDVILFVLFIGGFMQIFNQSGALVAALRGLTRRMHGKESWLIILLTFLFSFGGASYGMAEEGLVFYAVMIPLFLKAGYDLLVPVAVIFGGTQLGTLASFTNPFSTIIASNAAGVNWTDGLNMRVAIFFITTLTFIWYITRYANKVKRNPAASLVFKIDGNVLPAALPSENERFSELSGQLVNIVVAVFVITFLIMIGGVVFFDWWLVEMTTLFLGAAILMGFLLKMKEEDWVNQFIEGCKGMVAVGLIIGTARGVSILLDEGQIADSIIYGAAQLTQSMPPSIFIILMMFLFMIFTLFISSSSGMAVLTMPIMGSLATLVDVPGREIVNAYLFGMGVMGFLTPTGLILPSLAMANISFKTWLKFIIPFLGILLIICGLALLAGLFFF